MRLWILAASLCTCSSPSIGSATPESQNTLVYPEPTITAVKDLANNLGLSYESHSVTTEDGYILNLNRLVDSRTALNLNRGVPVLLINGLFLQSEAWMIQGSFDANIARTLAKRGYDVWLGDSRGTLRSMSHVNLTYHQPKFWDFSFHESGVYDLPAFIDFILKSTGHDRLIYGCMSLGCSYHFVLLSHKPEYNRKFIGGVDMVPVGKLWERSRMPSMTHLAFRLIDLLVKSYQRQNIGYVRDVNQLKTATKSLCRLNRNAFALLIQLVTGRFKNIDPSRLCEQLSLGVGGASIKTVDHVLQILETGDFAEFSYGREENMRRYGTELPPLYDLKKVTSFVALYSGQADVLTPSSAIDELQKQLGGPTYRCEIVDYHHMDFGIGKHFSNVIPDVIQLVDSLSGYANDSSKMLSGSCPQNIRKYG